MSERRPRSFDELCRAIGRAAVVLFDIDGTLTHAADGTDQAVGDGPWGNAVLGIVRDQLAARASLPVAESAARVRQFAESVVWWDYPDFIDVFELDATAVWSAARAWHAAKLRPHADAVRLARRLCAAGKQLAVMSNNPVTGCLLKLEVAGLGDLRGSRVFGRIAGANNLRGQKSRPEMWRRCLIHLGVAGEQVVTIGDNPLEDGEMPRAAGVGAAVVVTRRAPPAVPADERIWCVDGLDRLCRALA